MNAWTLQTLTPAQADEERDQIATDDEHALDLNGARLTFGTRDGVPTVLVELDDAAVIGIASPDLLTHQESGDDIIEMLGALDADEILADAGIKR